MISTIDLHAKISTKLIEQKLSSLIAEKLQNTKLEISGVQIQLKSAGKVQLRGERNQLRYQIPLDIHVVRPSGLFTVEGQGKVHMIFESNYKFDRHLNLHTHSKLVNHEWVEKPELQMGSLAIPVGTLINMIISHSESIIIGKIDQALEENVSIKNLLQGQFYNVIQENEMIRENGLAANINLELLNFNTISIEEDFTIIDGQLVGHYLIGNVLPNLALPQVTFQPDEGHSSVLSLPIQLKYSKLAAAINQYLPDIEIGGKKLEVVVDNISCDDRLKLEASVLQPAKMKVWVMANPVIEDGKLDLQNIEIDIKPASLLYKLFVPIIKSTIESKLSEFLPLEIMRFLDEFSSFASYKKEGIDYSILWDEVSIQDLKLENDQMTLIISVKELKLVATS